MESNQKYAKLKQYMQLFFLVMIAITIILIIIGNKFGSTLLIISAVGYFACGPLMRKVPEPDDKSFNTKIDFITKCVTYPTYVLLVILMAKTWFDRA